MNTPCIYLLLLLRMREPRPMQSCLVTNENKSYKVEKPSSTSSLSSVVNQNNKTAAKIVFKLPVIVTYS